MHRSGKSDSSFMLQTTQASTSAESANTTPIAQDPNMPPSDKESGSWSSSVGSWFALFKKPKKSGSEPAVLPESKTLGALQPPPTTSPEGEDEYDRRLVIHDFSRPQIPKGDDDDDDDESRFVDASDDPIETPRGSGALPVGAPAASPELDFESLSEPGNPPSHIVDMGNYASGNADDTIFEMDEQVDAPKYAITFRFSLALEQFIKTISL